MNANTIPVWSDEIYYQINAFHFYAHPDLAAAFTYNGQGASVGKYKSVIARIIPANE
ncbi:MAG: hypothetical protein Q4G27_11250 [Flavobacteriaceae bacterium]|nr:hypothetical protein [Flavobacteriaceae bacterium]